MSDLLILPAAADDAAVLLEIYRPYVESTAVSFEYDVPTVEEFSERIRNISSRFPYIKAVKDGSTLGYAYAAPFHPRKAYEWSCEVTIYLRQDARHQGIGRALYESLEKQLQKQGLLNMNACIALPKEDQDPYLTMDSPRFHEAMGFHSVGIFHDSGFKFNRWYHMVWMEKMIGEHSEHPAPVTYGGNQ